MSTLNNRRFRVVLSLALLVVLAASTFTPGSRITAADKVLRYNFAGEINTIDPQAASYVDEVALINAAFRGLMRYDKDGNAVPMLAQEVPTKENGGISADGKVYTFKLKDWNWSDGKGKVTAGDFVYSWQRLVDPKLANAYATFFNGVILNAQEISDGKKKPSDLGVKAIDDKTFQVTLVAPKSFFLQLATLSVTYPVRKDVVEKPGLATASAWTDPANGPVVSDGPFTITKWEHQKDIVFTKNPNYSGDPAKLDSVVVSLIQEPTVAFDSYKNDELDVSNYPIIVRKNIQTDPVLGKELVEYPLLCTFALELDNTKPPFNNVKVRQAFSYAIDRDAEIKVLESGLGVVTYSWIPPGMFGYDANAGKQYAFNPDKAKQLLAEAGYPDGKGFPTVPYNYISTTSNQRRAEWTQAQLLTILNVNVTLNPMDAAAYEQVTTDPKVKISGMERGGWCVDYPHPQDWFTTVFVNGKEGNGNNLSGFSDPAWEKLSVAADAEIDQTKALADYIALQNKLIDEAPVVFMYNNLGTELVKPRVKGLIPTSIDGGYPGSQFWESIDIQQ
jgi:oligopeptide transport system substrate-binding protein